MKVLNRQIFLRVPDGLKSKLQKAAVRNRRTLTAEIVYRLEQSLSAPQEARISEPAKTESS